MLVLDASVALAWCFEDEASAELDTLLVVAQDIGMLVPGLWHLELANAVKVAIRRKRTGRATLETAIGLFSLANLTVDDATAQHAWDATLALSDRHALTLYDAAYLELALRRQLPLASLDADLRAAAMAEGVIVLPE